MDVIQLGLRALDHLWHGQLPPTELITLILSKVLGYGIIAGATFVKVPQVLSVWQAKSARGLSMLAYEIETAAIAVSASYGYIRSLPFSMYGETVFVLAQNIMLLTFIYSFGKAPPLRWMVTSSLLLGAAAVVLSGQVTADHIKVVMDMNIGLLLASKLPQIFKNFRDGSTGRLSIITAALVCAGTLARIFTSLREGGGGALVRTYIIGTTLNALLLAQILWFGDKQLKVSKEKRQQ